MWWSYCREDIGILLVGAGCEPCTFTCSQAAKGSRWSCTICRESLISKCTVTHCKGLQRKTVAKSMAFSYGNAAAVVVLPRSCAVLKQRHNRNMSFLGEVVNNLYYWMLLLCYLFCLCQELGGGRGISIPWCNYLHASHLSGSPVYSAPNFSVCSTPIQGAVSAPYCGALLSSGLCLVWCPSIFLPAPDRSQLFFLKLSLNAVSW